MATVSNTSTIHVRASRESVRAAIHSLPQGVVADAGAAKEQALEDAGIAILARIHEAFITKSKGGTDDAGDRWAPLSPVTLAIRQRKYGSSPVPSRKRKAGGQRYDDVPPARRRLQNIIKGKGRTPTRNRYDGLRRDILVDTGALLDSLSPWSDSPDKIFKITASGVTLGTKRKGAMDHHTGNPERNLPQRRLWPQPHTWPDSWWQDIKDEVVQGIVRSVVERLRSL